MTRHRTVLSLLAVLLLATLAFRQGQEQRRVLVASDRTAAIELHGTDGEEGLSGDLEAGVDLAAGSSALRADLSLEDAEEIGDGTVDAFLEASGSATEAIGAIDLPVPDEAEGDAPGELDVAFRSVAGGEGSYATMDLELAGPSDEPVSTVALNGTVEGSPRAVSGAVDYTATVPEDRAGRIPVTDLSLSIADEATGSGESDSVVTTLTLSVTAPRGGLVAGQLRQASGVAAMFEQRLRQSGVQVDTFEVSPVEETDDGVTVDATVAVRNLRGTLGGFLGMAGAGMAQNPEVDAEALIAALSEMSRTRIDTFALTMSVSGREVSGRVSGEVSRLEHFFGGYTDFLRSTVGGAGPAREDSVPDELARYVTAFQEASIEQTARSLQAATESDLTFAGEGELNVGGTGDTTMRVDGAFDLTFDGYRDFAAEARAAGTPVPDTALVTADVHLTDAGRLEGEYYSYSDVGVLETYRSLFVSALERVEGADEAAARLEEASLEEAAFSLGLEGRDLTIRGYSRTSPLTEVARALLGELGPEIDGTPEGAHLDYAFRPDGTGEGALRIHFSDFMPDRSAAEIRQTLGLPDGAAVRTDASPDAVAPTRVERPRVEVSAELDAVRTSARELAAGGPGDGDGIPTWMVIAGAVLAAALLVAGWAGARRASRA